MEMLVHGNALLALAAAVLWGGGDFSGGMGVKQAGGSMGAALRVILMSHCTSLCVLLIIARTRGDAFPHGAALLWGLAAGVAGGTSLTAFYIALSRGAMGASAALSGLLAAAIPAAFSEAWEGSPGILQLAGFLVAGISIWLIAAGENAEAKTAERSTVWLAVIGGVGFGIYFTALKVAAAKTGVIWPLATCRLGSLTVCSLMLAGISLGRKKGFAPVQVTRPVVLWAMGTALLDTSGNMLFVAATRAGRLDIAAVLASLYPASTILLAAWMLRERPTRRQAWGMAVAAAAVVMVAL